MSKLTAIRRSSLRNAPHVSHFLMILGARESIYFDGIHFAEERKKLLFLEKSSVSCLILVLLACVDYFFPSKWWQNLIFNFSDNAIRLLIEKRKWQINVSIQRAWTIQVYTRAGQALFENRRKRQNNRTTRSHQTACSLFLTPSTQAFYGTASITEMLPSRARALRSTLIAVYLPAHARRERMPRWKTRAQLSPDARARRLWYPWQFSPRASRTVMTHTYPSPVILHLRHRCRGAMDARAKVDPFRSARDPIPASARRATELGGQSSRYRKGIKREQSPLRRGIAGGILYLSISLAGRALEINDCGSAGRVFGVICRVSALHVRLSSRGWGCICGASRGRNRDSRATVVAMQRDDGRWKCEIVTDDATVVLMIFSSTIGKKWNNARQCRCRIKFKILVWVLTRRGCDIWWGNFPKPLWDVFRSLLL